MRFIQLKKNSEKTKKPRKIYNPLWNLIFSLVFTFLAGGILGGVNYIRLGKKKKGIICMLVSIGVFAAFVLTESFISTEYFIISGLSLNIISGFLLNADQKKEYREHIKSGGKKALIIFPFIITLIVIIITAFLCVLYTLKQPVDKLTYYDDTLYYTSTITKEEAQKFRDFLADDDVFVNDNNKIAVKLDRSGSVYYVSMIVDEKDINDEEINSAMTDLAKVASKSVFNGAEVDVRLCDNSFRVEKQIKP